MNGLTQPGGFYAAPEPEEPQLEQERLQDSGEFERANALPAKATPPPYLSTKRFTDTGVDTFAPSSTPILPQLAEVKRPPLPALPVLAAVVFGAYVLFGGTHGRR